jgi:hypothetical protein
MEARKLMEQHLRMAQAAQGMERPSAADRKAQSGAPRGRQPKLTGVAS